MSPAFRERESFPKTLRWRDPLSSRSSQAWPKPARLEFAAPRLQQVDYCGEPPPPDPPWPRMASPLPDDLLSAENCTGGDPELEEFNALRLPIISIISILFTTICAAGQTYFLVVLVCFARDDKPVRQAGLGFLGLSDPTVPSWGEMLNRGQEYLELAWWMSVFPGLAICLAVLGFNLFADGLTEMLNPRASAAAPKLQS